MRVYSFLLVKIINLVIFFLGESAIGMYEESNHIKFELHFFYVGAFMFAWIFLHLRTTIIDIKVGD